MKYKMPSSTTTLTTRTTLTMTVLTSSTSSTTALLIAFTLTVTLSNLNLNMNVLQVLTLSRKIIRILSSRKKNNWYRNMKAPDYQALPPLKLSSTACGTDLSLVSMVLATTILPHSKTIYIRRWRRTTVISTTKIALIMMLMKFTLMIKTLSTSSSDRGWPRAIAPTT